MPSRYSMATLAAAVGFALSSPALASTLTIDVPGDGTPNDITAGYVCGDLPLNARYVSEGEVAIATLAWEDHFVVAAEVMAASGARYAAGPYVWWVKGNDATLYDIRKGEDDPGVACSTAG